MIYIYIYINLCTLPSAKPSIYFVRCLMHGFFWRAPSCSGTKASQLCGILWSPHREHLRTKATATAEKYHLFFGSIFDSKKEIWRDEDVKFFFCFVFFVWFWVILKCYPTFGGGEFAKVDETGHFLPQSFMSTWVFFVRNSRLPYIRGH